MALSSRALAFFASLFTFMILFVALAHAQEAPPLDLANLTLSSVAALLIWAVQHKAYRYIVAVALIGVTAGLRALQGIPALSNMSIFRWVKTDRGGTLSVLLLSECAGISTALMLPTFSWMHLVDAASMALTAVGGYTVLKRLFTPADKVGVKLAVVPPPLPMPSPPTDQAGFITLTLSGVLSVVGIIFMAIVLLSGCGPCYTPTDPSYNTEKCVVARQVVDCTTDSVKGESGRGMGIVNTLINSGTVDTASLIAALVTAGIKDGECILAALFNDFASKPAASENRAKALANYNAWRKDHRQGVKYKLVAPSVAK